MNKTIKRNVLVSAILAIMLCVSLIAGATFALFTSESKVNIAVTSGKVSVVANIDETSVQTKQLIQKANSLESLKQQVFHSVDKSKKLPDSQLAIGIFLFV